ncbi:hypothetical protein KP509_37G051600 [Ceratopteris richardii]|uniref:Xyloglucan endotransglucosylase/hydrolase n=1 Tax=Ceratopteris richardii TaxID=49495 RepID=A0A8T2QA04_CERRI|nr:hypothetical protein KP509_37G051600 [Ceratopteris richardii]
MKEQIACNMRQFQDLRSLAAAVCIVCSCTNVLGVYTDDFHVTWGAPNNTKLVDGGEVMQLMLDNHTAAGFASNKMYLFGSIDMQIKLIPGDSAGVVTAYYFSSELTPSHDEVDFEFLGNVTSQPYILQTNIFANGVGGREQRIYLWFDPSADFHSYSLLWNEQQIVLSVDGIPIRRFANNEAVGMPYLRKQPMGIYASIWDGGTWATRGGLDKVDWGSSPFVAEFGRYKVDACEGGKGTMEEDGCPSGKWWNEAAYQELSYAKKGQLSWVRSSFLVYDYCTDSERYPVPPPECSIS